MARFPYYEKNVRKLGEILARARTDETFRRKFIENPKSALSEVGLPGCVHELMTFEVIDGSDHKATALPYRLNQGRLDRQDPDYLATIAYSFTSVN